MKKSRVFVFKGGEPEWMCEDSQDEIHRVMSRDYAKHNQHLVDQKELCATQGELRTDPFQQCVEHHRKK